MILIKLSVVWIFCWKRRKKRIESFRKRLVAFQFWSKPEALHLLSGDQSTRNRGADDQDGSFNQILDSSETSFDSLKLDISLIINVGNSYDSVYCELGYSLSSHLQKLVNIILAAQGFALFNCNWHENLHIWYSLLRSRYLFLQLPWNPRRCVQLHLLYCSKET